MQINRVRQGHERWDEFKAEKPSHLRPHVKEVVTKDGIEYVETKCGRTFVAATFFKIFGTDIKDRIRSPRYKGRNPSRFLELIHS